MKKNYLEITKWEILRESIFIGILTSLFAGSFRYGLLSVVVTIIVWSILMYILGLIWFSFTRKGVIKIEEKIKGKIKSIKRAGKQDSMESE